MRRLQARACKATRTLMPPLALRPPVTSTLSNHSAHWHPQYDIPVSSHNFCVTLHRNATVASNGNWSASLFWPPKLGQASLKGNGFAQRLTLVLRRGLPIASTPMPPPPESCPGRRSKEEEGRSREVEEGRRRKASMTESQGRCFWQHKNRRGKT